jgi:glycosyltransferase involved in cell wall biosynthesis
MTQPAREQGIFTALGLSDLPTFLERECQLQKARQRNPRPPHLNTSAVKLSILMPVYNEESTIVRAVEEITNVDYPCEIELIVVDDGSTDATGVLISQIRDARVMVHTHLVNQGKGAALLSAASLASGTHVIPFDADLEYLAEDIPRMLEPVLKGRCNVVYGTRLFGFNTVYQSYRYAAGNRLLTFLANVFFDANLSDLHTCLKLMPAAVLKDLRFREVRFGLDTEVTALLLRQGVRPFEVPVSYYSRSHAQGKKITWRDAIKCIWILLRMRLWVSSFHKPINGIDLDAVHYASPSNGSGGSGVSPIACVSVKNAEFPVAETGHPPSPEWLVDIARQLERD